MTGGGHLNNISRKARISDLESEHYAGSDVNRSAPKHLTNYSSLNYNSLLFVCTFCLNCRTVVVIVFEYATNVCRFSELFNPR